MRQSCSDSLRKVLCYWIFEKQRIAWFFEDSQCTKVIQVLDVKIVVGYWLQHNFRCYQLSDCFLNVRLSMEHHPASNLNTTVEVFGEVRLYDGSKNSKKLESAHGLISKLRNLQTRLEEEMELPSRPPSGTNDKTMNSFVKSQLQKEIESFKKTYKPVIQVYTLRHIQEAHEIIVENLHYRLIQKRRKTCLSLR